MLILSKAKHKSAGTLASQVYEILRAKIIDGQINPGANLVRRKLSKELGVSPVPITEALWRLEQDGLVEYEPMYGSRVRQLSIQSIKDELILREAIECQSARLCAESATEIQINSLRELAKDIDKLEHGGNLNSKEGAQAHIEFHLTITRYGGSRVLEKELQRVGYRELMRLKWVNADRVAAPPNWHSELVEALSHRDQNRAEQKMREHVRYGMEVIWQALQILHSLQM